jgi:transcriptional regulator with XRE-family HTH domain
MQVTKGEPGVVGARHRTAEAALVTLLKKKRIEAGLTQAELAVRLGYTQAFVSKYEHGDLRLSFGQVAAVCRALGVPLVSFVSEWEAAAKRG